MLYLAAILEPEREQIAFLAAEDDLDATHPVDDTKDPPTAERSKQLSERLGGLGVAIEVAAAHETVPEMSSRMVFG